MSVFMISICWKCVIIAMFLDSVQHVLLSYAYRHIYVNVSLMFFAMHSVYMDTWEMIRIIVRFI